MEAVSNRPYLDRDLGIDDRDRIGAVERGGPADARTDHDDRALLGARFLGGCGNFGR